MRDAATGKPLDVLPQNASTEGETASGDANAAQEAEGNAGTCRCSDATGATQETESAKEAEGDGKAEITATSSGESTKNANAKTMRNVEEVEEQEIEIRDHISEDSRGFKL